jgi:subtilisin family serine protease
MVTSRPAWSSQFAPDQVKPAPDALPHTVITPEWAWEGATGKGVRVGVIDSGVDNNHPAVDGHVTQWARFLEDRAGVMHEDFGPHDDAFGHGTACADIIRRLAPDVEFTSIQVLGPALTGKGSVFVHGLRWAIEQGLDVINLSLGSTKRDYFSVFHELTDLAYFKGIVLVTAANNMPVESYPSLYSTVISVACHEGSDPYQFYYNPNPPVEFGAPGININVGWLGGKNVTVTGNSFSAPHITGLVAKVLSKHKGLTPFQVKTVLRATAVNARMPAARQVETPASAE